MSKTYSNITGMGKISTLITTAREYAEASTVHGVSYIFSWSQICFTCKEVWGNFRALKKECLVDTVYAYLYIRNLIVTMRHLRGSP